MAKWSACLFGHYKHRYELREIEYSDNYPIVAYGYNNEPYYYLVSSWEGVGLGLHKSGYTKYTEHSNQAGAVKIQKVVSRHVDEPTEYDNGRYFVYNVIGWEKRAMPGDITAIRPPEHRWTAIENKRFMIVEIDNIDEIQEAGIVERLWDTNSYMIVDPKQISKEVELYPSASLKKRRFHIPLNDLETFGVDIEKMLDKELIYKPKISILEKTDVFDKLNNRHINETDQLRPIAPLIVKPSVKGL